MWLIELIGGEYGYAERMFIKKPVLPRLRE
jgi:hypothetical protein